MVKKDYTNRLSSEARQQITAHIYHNAEQKADAYSKKEDEQSLYNAVGLYFAAGLSYGVVGNSSAMKKMSKKSYLAMAKLSKKTGRTSKELLEEITDRIIADMPKAMTEARRARASGTGTGVGVTALIGLISGLFFLSPNVTGNAIAIGNLTNQTSSLLGVGLLVIGLIAGFFWMKK